MSTTSVPTPASTPPVPLASRLEQMQRDLALQRARTDRATLLTAAIGLVAMLLIGGYFFYGYRQISSQLEPRILVDTAAGLIAERKADVRKALRDQITQSAPGWAQNLNKQALSMIPDARKKLEATVLEQMTSNLDEAKVLSEEQFKVFLKQNRALIEKSLKDLSKDPKLADAAIRDLEQALDETFQTEMRAQTKELLHGLASINARLKRIKDNVDLTEEERLERQLIVLVRRLQVEQTVEGIDPGLGLDGSPTASASTKTVSETQPARAPTKGKPAPKQSTTSSKKPQQGKN